MGLGNLSVHQLKGEGKHYGDSAVFLASHPSGHRQGLCVKSTHHGLHHQVNSISTCDENQGKKTGTATAPIDLIVEAFLTEC